MLSRDDSPNVCSETPQSCQAQAVQGQLRRGVKTRNVSLNSQVQQQALSATKNEAGPHAHPQDDKCNASNPRSSIDISPQARHSLQKGGVGPC